jgi:hypothetical protein
MTDGGSISNRLTATREGEPVTVEVIVSGDSVELGGWTFSREELLFSLGARADDAAPPGR